MSVYKRKSRTGKIGWAYQFDSPGSTPEARKRITESGFASKKEAIEAEAARRVQAIADHKAEEVRTGAPKTLGDLLQEFCADCDERGISAKTLERYRQQVAYVSDELAAMDLREVKPLMLHHEWRRMADSGGRGRRAGKPLSPKTVRNIAGMVGAAYGRALFWGLADSNPTINSEPPKLEHAPIPAMTLQQQKLLLETPAHPVLPILLELSAATGARRGEVLAMRWADLQAGRIVIERSLSQVGSEIAFKSTKTGKGRVVTLPPSTVAALDRHRAAQQLQRDALGDGYRAELDLIVCQPDGAPLKPDSISAAVSLLCRKLKLPKGVSLHALRHTHASQLLAGGVEITAVAARLGHSSPATTMKVYAHAISGRDDHAAKVIDLMREIDVNSASKQ